MSAPSYEIIKFPVAGDSNNDPSGVLHIFGAARDDADARAMIFVCPGFPDGPDAMHALAAHWASQGCVVGVTCLPGFDKSEPWKQHCRRWGYSFGETVDALRQAVKLLTQQHKHKIAEIPLHFVLHDWGCFVGSMLANLEDAESPYRPNKIVYLDILPPAPGEFNIPGLYQGAVFAAYTAILAYSYVLLHCVRRHVATAYMLGMFVFAHITRLLPTGPLDAEYFEERKVPVFSLVYYCYPYYYMYVSKLWGRDRACWRAYRLPDAADNIAVLYLYGVDKNIMFHSASTIKFIRQGRQPKSQVHAITNAGHWLHIQQTELVTRKIDAFLFGK